MKLSVVIPNYNHGHFLQDLLPTLFAQSKPPDEVVIVDDGSTDQSVEIIKAFTKREKRVRLFQNDANRGVVYSLNFALSQAEGDLVTFPSADNFVLPGMYEKSLKILQEYPQAMICCSDPVVFYEISGVKETRRLCLSTTPRYFSLEETVNLSAATGFSIGSVVHTIVARKTALLETGLNGEGFISSLQWHCDFFAFNAIAFRYGFCYIPEGLAMFRESSQSYSHTPKSWKVRKKVYQTLLAILDLPQNQDIKRSFKKSAILGEFTDSMLRVLLSSPVRYEYFTWRLSKRLFHACSWIFLRKVCRSLLPKGLYAFLKARFQKREPKLTND